MRTTFSGFFEFQSVFEQLLVFSIQNWLIAFVLLLYTNILVYTCDANPFVNNIIVNCKKRKAGNKKSSDDKIFILIHLNIIK
jgi:hypothetical protein